MTCFCASARMLILVSCDANGTVDGTISFCSSRQLFKTCHLTFGARAGIMPASVTCDVNVNLSANSIK